MLMVPLNQNMLKTDGIHTRKNMCCFSNLFIDNMEQFSSNFTNDSVVSNDSFNGNIFYFTIKILNGE